MPDDDSPDITGLLLRANSDSDAKAQLYDAIYHQLKSLAHPLMNRNRASDLQTTALVNEVFLRFEKTNAVASLSNRRMFFSLAIQAMNQVLIDHYRRRRKLIDSPDREAEPLDDAVAAIEDDLGCTFESLHEVLEQLSRDSPRQHAVVVHRYFAGLTVKQTAELLEVAEGTVERDWRLARAKLYRQLKDDPG